MQDPRGSAASLPKDCAGNYFEGQTCLEVPEFESLDTNEEVGGKAMSIDIFGQPCLSYSDAFGHFDLRQYGLDARCYLHAFHP